MKKIVFADKKTVLSSLGMATLFSGNICMYMASYLMDGMLFFRIMGIPYFLFFVFVQVGAFMNMFSFIVLCPDEIRFYGLFVPIAILKIETVPHIEIKWNEYKHRYDWFFLSDYSTNTEHIVDSPYKHKDEIHIAGVFDPDKVWRVIRGKIYGNAINHFYSQKYDYAIREYYGIGANMWKL